MLQSIVALLLMKRANSLDVQHKETLNNVDKVMKVIRVMNGFNGR